jgi:hypothetical protein
MGRLRKAPIALEVAAVTVLLALLPGAAPSAAQPQPLNESDYHFIKELVVAEVWRPGGSDAEALAEVLAGFLRSGNYEAATWLVREATPFVYRRLLDPTPLATVVDRGPAPGDPANAAEWQHMRRDLGDCVELSALPPGRRLALYHELIGTRKLQGAFGLSFVDACLRGMWEDPREFLTEAEGACFNPEGIWARADARDFGKASFRVARARADTSPMDAVLGLIDTAVKAELHQGEPADGIPPDELLDEALLGLLMDKQTKAIARLKKIWLAIPVPSSSDGRAAQIRADLAARGRWDKEPPRDSVAGRHLMRAIRGLGDTSFQAKNLKFDPWLVPDLELCRQALQDRGLYQPEKK